MHKPIVVTVETSPAAPLLTRLKANETISEVKLNFTPVAPNTPSHSFVIKTI